LGSSWHLDCEVKSVRGVRHPMVVGDDRSQLRADNLRGRKMDRIQATQLSVWGQRRSAIEQLGGQQDLVEARELTARLSESGGSADKDRSHHLDSRERARHELVGKVTTQKSSQSGRLRLLLDQLYQRRRVEIEPHRSSARIVANRPEASMP
jgi:hypothetical protein